MRVVVDTNVLLDALASREPFRDDAEKVLLRLAVGEAQGMVVATSLTDIFYILRRQLGCAEARSALRKVLRILSPADVLGQDCRAALDSAMDDFEDAILLEVASRHGADCVVTRDERLIASDATPPGVLPSDFLADLDKADTP
ncbi:MAG: PIN domain-containing protein [Micrococcales bacterium]|nr:PIN domain-containing protein [Micrococcales bacterium]MCL2666426.1 PIN domain-containing protein [Micrococcales bacterium]